MKIIKHNIDIFEVLLEVSKIDEDQENLLMNFINYLYKKSPVSVKNAIINVIKAQKCDLIDFLKEYNLLTNFEDLDLINLNKDVDDEFSLNR